MIYYRSLSSTASFPGHVRVLRNEATGSSDIREGQSLATSVVLTD